MNTVCAAGTGSFLDRQAERLSIAIEEFGSYSIKSTNPVRIAIWAAILAKEKVEKKKSTSFKNFTILDNRFLWR